MAKNFVDQETVIEADDANRWEGAVEKNSTQDTEIQGLKQKDTTIEGKVTTLEGKVSTLEGKVVNATTATPGLVKQSTAVPEATGANATKEEFKALLDALKAAGIMANS